MKIKNNHNPKEIQESSSPSTHDLVGQFNYIFEGLAEAVVKEGELKITIGNRTMVVQLPIVLGAQSMG